MNAPETKLNVYQRLSNARAEFHTLKLTKSGHNKFAGYKYFELADFLIPAMDVFRKHGIVGIVSFHSDSACLVITNLDDPRDTATIFTPMSSAALKGCHEVQNLGAVQTYLRRYLWVAALEIVEHDAVDSSKPLEENDERKKIVDGFASFAAKGTNSLTALRSKRQGGIYDEIWDEFSAKWIEIAEKADQELAGAM